MKLKIFALIALASLGMACANAQQLKVKEITKSTETVGDVKDLNGNQCALMRFDIGEEGVKFQGNVIGEPLYSNGEYLVYVTDGTKFLMVQCPGVQSQMITFNDFGINSVVGGEAYKVNAYSTNNVGTLDIQYTPEGAEVMVDGEIVGTTPMKYQTTPGVHKVKITMEGKGWVAFEEDVEVKANQTNELSGVLENENNVFTNGGLALYNEGVNYLYGKNGVKKNVNLAIQKLEEAYDKGWDKACDVLGDCYNQGLTGTVDKAKAIEWYQKGADRFNVGSSKVLAQMYIQGDGVEPNGEKAISLLKPIADFANDNEAQALLGLIYVNGFGLPAPDIFEGVNYLTKASDQGNSGAKLLLGTLYYQGLGGVPQDQTKGIGLITDAAVAGNVEAQTQLALLCVDNGRYKQALHWANQAYENKSLMAPLLLGMIYENGLDGVDKDLKKAKKYYQECVANGIEPIKTQAEQGLERLK